MEAHLKPIPALYCCYLLRSTVRHSSLYVGSTPHPARRIAQHNGKVKGGAVRTARSSLRPWEMVCIVNGFPSNIAALQFEWAWQNPHLTRHISSDARLSLPVTRVKSDSKTGKKRKRPGRPRTSLIDKLSNLHLLLRAPYFSHWPLQLTFFNPAVHKTWLAWNGRVDEQIKPHIGINLDLPPDGVLEDRINDSEQQVKKRRVDLIGKGGIEGLDPTYAKFKDVLQKLNDCLQDKTSKLACTICHQNIDTRKSLFNTCLQPNCQSLAHTSCLSTRFLKEANTEALVPVEGRCPSCRTKLKWADLMRVLSLTLRGEKEVNKLMKKRKKSSAEAASQMLDEESMSEDDAPDTDVELVEDDLVDENQSESEMDDDDASVSSVGSSQASQPPALRTAAAQSIANLLEIVIEDSEED